MSLYRLRANEFPLIGLFDGAFYLRFHDDLGADRYRKALQLFCFGWRRHRAGGY